MLPPQFKFMGIDKQAIESIHQKNEKEELKKYGIDLTQIEQIQQVNDKLVLHVRRIEIKLNNSEKELRSLIEALQKRVEELENKLKQQRMQELMSQNNPYVRPKKKKISRPIDRNGVAPADVSLDKFFNFSHKRF